MCQCNFLCWLERAVDDAELAPTLNEVSVSDKLREFRR